MRRGTKGIFSNVHLTGFLSGFDVEHDETIAAVTAGTLDATNVTYVDILMRNSIDMLIVSALQRKIKISAETLGEEVKRWLTN